MQYGRVRAALVLVLAVAALGTAGAAIQTDGTGGDSPGAGSGEGLGLGGGEDGFFDRQEPPEGGDGGGWIGYALFAAALGGLVFGVAFLLQALFNWSVDELLAFLRTTVGRAIGLLVLAAVAYLLVQFLPDLAGGGSSGGLGSVGDGAGSTASEATGVDLPLGAIVAIVGLLALLLVLAIRSTRADDDGSDAGVAATDPADDAAPVPGGAGGSAPPPGTVPADNEVYRTWLALADAADANPRRHSPRTVAERAREAGVDEAAIREATALFEAVRYGGQPASEDRVRRAREAREALTGASSP